MSSTKERVWQFYSPFCVDLVNLPKIESPSRGLKQHLLSTEMQRDKTISSAIKIQNLGGHTRQTIITGMLGRKALSLWMCHRRRGVRQWG